MLLSTGIDAAQQYYPMILSAYSWRSKKIQNLNLQLNKYELSTATHTDQQSILLTTVRTIRKRRFSNVTPLR